MELFFRRATLNDRETVSNILTAFGGRDYLPSKYNEMISDPNFVGVVAEIDRPRGDMVGFAGAYITDGGTTMSTKGSRVREDLHGQGIYGKMWNFLKDTIREMSPRLKYEEFSSNTLSNLLDVPVKQRKYVELYRRPIKYYNLPVSIQQSLESGLDGDRVMELDDDTLRRILANEKLCNYFFPRRLVIEWDVYKPIVENADLIQKRTKYVTGSFSSKNRDDLQLVLFGSWFNCPQDGTLAYTLDCYGKMTDIAELAEHFRKHAKKAFSLSKNKVTILVFGEDEILESVDRVCLQLSFEFLKFFSTHCVVFVRDLDDTNSAQG